MAMKYDFMLLSVPMEITEIKNLNITDLAFGLEAHGEKPFIFSTDDYIYASANPFKNFSSGDKSYTDGFDDLGRFAQEFKNFEKGPYRFNGGLVGRINYDGNDLIVFHCYDPIIVIDKKTNIAKLVSHKTGGYKERTKELLKAIESGKSPYPTDSKTEQTTALIKDISPNISKESYCSIIGQAKEYIASGDIYQINLSMDFQGTLQGKAIELYYDLLTNHHSRYCYYLDTNDHKYIVNSPERFVQLQSDTLTTEPIKGTRPRGRNGTEDNKLKEDLKNSVKENAEHVMIVDLERNDLGKICKQSSVKVKDFKRIETYPSLFHMTSTIEGILRDAVSNVQAIKEMFPGGSITGTPKKRAMEIISELEKRKRGIYTGAVGWIDFNGDFDFAMAIRTASIGKNNNINFSVGSGIVIDSVPEEEYNESMLKGSDFLSPTTEQVKTK